MPWLRVDDGFTRHPKIAALNDRQFRTWMRLLCWSAAYRADGVVTVGVIGELRIRPRDLERFLELGLLDPGEDESLLIHDWRIYNGVTVDERVAAFFESNPSASANDAARSVGGNRKAALAAARQYLSGSNGGSNAGSEAVPEVVTRARTPSPLEEPSAVNASSLGEERTARDFRIPEELTRPMPS